MGLCLQSSSIFTCQTAQGMDRMPLRSDVSCPEWVLVHIYNLSQKLELSKWPAAKGVIKGSLEVLTSDYTESCR